jgi:hypothetical protein
MFEGLWDSPVYQIGFYHETELVVRELSIVHML